MSDYLRELEAEANELQRQISSKYPGVLPKYWTEELTVWQSRLWQLGYLISREKANSNK